MSARPAALRSVMSRLSAPSVLEELSSVLSDVDKCWTGFKKLGPKAFLIPCWEQGTKAKQAQQAFVTHLRIMRQATGGSDRWLVLSHNENGL